MKGLKDIRKARQREAAKYSQAAVAEAIGISVPTLIKYETDPGEMPAKIARRLAAYLGCEMEDIFFAD